jgi:hypothetical protein
MHDVDREGLRHGGAKGSLVDFHRIIRTNLHPQSVQLYSNSSVSRANLRFFNGVYPAIMTRQANWF